MTQDSGLRTVIIYTAFATCHRRRETATVALLNCGSLWKAVGMLHHDLVVDDVAAPGTLAYALDHLKEPCRVRLVASHESVTAGLAAAEARNPGSAGHATWYDIDEARKTHEIIEARHDEGDPVIRLCEQFALAAAEGRLPLDARLAELAADARALRPRGELPTPPSEVGEPVAGSQGRYAYRRNGECATRSELRDERHFEHVETFYQDAGRELGHTILRRKADGALFEISDWATSTIGYQVVATPEAAPAPFGYRCQECGEGTVRGQVFAELFTKIRGIPVSIKDARVGVCDSCGAQHFDPNETARWRTTPEVVAALRQLVDAPAKVEVTREDALKHIRAIKALKRGGVRIDDPAAYFTEEAERIAARIERERALDPAGEELTRLRDWMTVEQYFGWLTRVLACQKAYAAVLTGAAA